MKGKRTIVVAWTSLEHQVDPTRPWRGERPWMQEVVVGRAALWRNEGTDKDVKEAKAYAARETARIDPSREYPALYGVFEYPTTEPEPKARARLDIVARERRLRATSHRKSR